MVPSHTLLFVSRCQKCHTENSVIGHETSKILQIEHEVAFSMNRDLEHILALYGIKDTNFTTCLGLNGFFLTYSLVNISSQKTRLYQLDHEMPKL